MEKLELYDEDRNRTGEFIVRGDPIPKGRYKMVAAIWIENAKGECLIQKRAKNPDIGMWAFTGGHLDIGEDSQTAIIRETKEELGYTIGKPTRITSFMDDAVIVDLYYIKEEIDVNNLVLEKSEVEDAKWVTPEELNNYVKNKQFAEMQLDFYDNFKTYL